MLDGKKLIKWKIERVLSYIISTNEWISLNGNVKKIVQAKHNTKRKRRDITKMFPTTTKVKKNIRSIEHESCFDVASSSHMNIVEYVS